MVVTVVPPMEMPPNQGPGSLNYRPGSLPVTIPPPVVLPVRPG